MAQSVTEQQRLVGRPAAARPGRQSGGSRAKTHPIGTAAPGRLVRRTLCSHRTVRTRNAESQARAPGVFAQPHLAFVAAWSPVAAILATDVDLRVLARGEIKQLVPTSAQAAAAPQPRVGSHDVDQGAPSMARWAGFRAGQYRAGVYRQPRRLRRAERPARGARRAALARRDRPGVLAAGPPAAHVSRDRHALGADHRARGLRLQSLPTRSAARLVAWTGALPPAIRRFRRARFDSITKTGSKYARRILVEASWQHARPPARARPRAWPCSLARSTASAILRRIRATPAAAALVSHRSAPSPIARNSRSSADRARGLRASAPAGRGG